MKEKRKKKAAVKAAVGAAESAAEGDSGAAEVAAVAAVTSDGKLRDLEVLSVWSNHIQVLCCMLLLLEIDSLSIQIIYLV